MNKHIGLYKNICQDKEVDCGGAPPRVLVLDDYFMTEVEKVEKDPDTGRKIKTKVSVNLNRSCSQVYSWNSNSLLLCWIN